MHRSQQNDVEPSTARKTETTSATSAAVPSTFGMDTAGALRRVGSRCALAQAFVHGAICPSTITLGAPMLVMQRHPCALELRAAATIASNVMFSCCSPELPSEECSSGTSVDWASSET